MHGGYIDGHATSSDTNDMTTIINSIGKSLTRAILFPHVQLAKQRQTKGFKHMAEW